MKKRKFLLTLSMTIFIVVMLSTITYGEIRYAGESNNLPTDAAVKIAGPDPVDIEFRSTDLKLDLSNLSAFSSVSLPGCGEDYDVGNTVIALGINWLGGYAYIKSYTVKAIGTSGEVWIADDLGWLPGDPRTYPEITDEQINYLLNEFDNNIYTKDTEFFGLPDYHDGTQAIFDDILRNLGIPVPPDYYCNPDIKDRVIIMVDNVIDENYLDPEYPIYIAGVYASNYDVYFDRNVITIDSYEWEKRMGPPGPGIERPYLYEGVIAHEFQHLIHFDKDPDEDVFVQEGCSDLAYWLCGYGHPQSHVDFLIDHPQNSLTVWGDQGPLEILADYGIAYLWTLYLYEHFGGASFIKAMVNNQGNGIDGINAALDEFGYIADFENVFRNYKIALLLDSPQPFCQPYISFRHQELQNSFKPVHPYQFKNIDIHVNIDNSDEACGSTYAPPWGTDYIKMENADRLKLLEFDGSDFLPTQWISDGQALWSGAADMMDNFLITKVDLTGSSNSTLTFDTWYSIEPGWDFGFVQVSIDNGNTWTSLANPDTTDIHDPFAHPKVIANLPGFTGNSGGGMYPAWVPEALDLSAYDGRNILLAFRYVTDWTFSAPGWLVDNIKINGAELSDGSSTEGFMSIHEVLGIDNDFSVTLVGINEKKGKTTYKVKDVLLRDLDEVGYAFLAMVIRDGGYGAMLVSFEAPKDTTMYAHYEYSLLDIICQ